MRSGSIEENIEKIPMHEQMKINIRKTTQMLPHWHIILESTRSITADVKALLGHRYDESQYPLTASL